MSRTRQMLASVAATAIASAGMLVVASPAEAAGRYFSSCDSLNRVYPSGVARSKKAAKRQYRRGFERPAAGKRARAVYRENSSRLDRDRDGTACEQSR